MSARRGVHHSGGLAAKRRWLKWRRYQRRCNAVVGTSPWARKQFAGYRRAYAHWMDAGRYPPIGIRDVRP